MLYDSSQKHRTRVCFTNTVQRYKKYHQVVGEKSPLMHFGLFSDDLSDIIAINIIISRQDSVYIHDRYVVSEVGEVLGVYLFVSPL